MTMKPGLRTALCGAGMALALLCGAARADDVPMVNGEHWMRSSEEVKKAYLVGMVNIMQVETAYYSTNPPTDSQSFVPRVTKGLKGHTLDSVREGLNKWYAAHPDQLRRPVIETLWFELVVPGLQKSN